MNKLLRGLFFLCLLSNAFAKLKIGAFNIQVFGQSKIKEQEVVDILIRITQRYDVLLVQEIRDSKQTAFTSLVDQLNSVSEHDYKSSISIRTGRSSSKEQYAFIYRPDKVLVMSEYQYPDVDDVFEREPFVVQFRRLDTNFDGPSEFSIIALHAKPGDADNEIDKLVEVYEEVTNIYGKESLLAGDFNADCSYVCKSCWNKIDLRKDDRFTWLLGDAEDTTVSDTDCSYDRLVVAGTKMTGNSNDAKVFRFDAEYGLTNTEAKDVSDHYPVEFTLN